MEAWEIEAKKIQDEIGRKQRELDTVRKNYDSIDTQKFRKLIGTVKGFIATRRYYVDGQGNIIESDPEADDAKIRSALKQQKKKLRDSIRAAKRDIIKIKRGYKIATRKRRDPAITKMRTELRHRISVQRKIAKKTLDGKDIAKLRELEKQFAEV